jgi:hypothetical protein
MGAKPGLRLEVVQRLGTLERINQWLESRDDEWEQIDNVLAIIAAYEDRTLRWNPRLVTYWSMDVQLCEPRPYDINEYLYLNGQYKGHTGFWVEGVCFNQTSAVLHSTDPCFLGSEGNAP